MGLKGAYMRIPSEFLIGSVNQASTEQQTSNAMLDQEGFLKIIAAEISNPSFDGGDGGSGSQTDFMGQLIQMNMLDQMTELTTSIQNTMMMTQQQQALSLVGKEVTVAGLEEGLVTGIVDKVRFSNGFATIQIDGVNYNLNNIIEVGGESNAE